MEQIDRYVDPDGKFEWFRRGLPPYAINGKYLFYSSDREQLVRIAEMELLEGGFHVAKVVTDKGRTDDYVLCLYYEDETRKGELNRKYGGIVRPPVAFWKTEEATLRGEYSERFLRKLERQDAGS